MRILDIEDKDAKKLREIRARIAVNDAAHAALTKTRLTDDEIRQRVDDELENYARYATDALDELAFWSEGPRHNILAAVMTQPRALARLLKVPLTDAIVTLVIEAAGDEPPLSEQDRQAKLQALASERSELERADELEVLRQEAAGYDAVPRRQSFDVEIVLELAAGHCTVPA